MNSDYQAQKGTDETGKKTKKTALNRDGSHLIELYVHAPIGIVECSLDGKYINFNEEFCRITGHTKEELLRLHIHDLILPADSVREDALYKELISGSLPFYNIEQRYVRKNGAIIWVGIIRSLVREVGGEPLYTLGIVQDISHRKAVQEILRKSEATLQQKNIELEKLLQEGVTDLKMANLALVEGQKNMELLSQRFFDAQEDERRLIAGELHDGISQSLAALKMNLVLISDEVLATTQQETDARLADSIALAAQVIDLVRSVMTDLRPTGLDDFGLEDSLSSVLEQFRFRYKLNVQFEKSDPPISRLDPNLEMALIRIAQEALLNIAKYANTKEATLTLRQEEDRICLAIEDKGAGIKPLESVKRSAGHGMKIMRERAEAFGGDFNVTSVPGQGTKIEVRVPIDAGNERKFDKNYSVSST
jgi:PAS domain S-box-containing protein